MTNIVVLVAILSFISICSSAPYICSLAYGTYTTSEPFLGYMNNTIAMDNRINRTSYIVQWYQNWGDGSGQWSNVAGFLKIALNFTSAKAANVHVPLLTWQPWGPKFTKTPAEFPFANISAGSYNTYIDTWATGISQLNYTVFLRPMHEFDGDWYPWGQVNGNTAAGFIAAWRQIHSRFTAKNVKNVKFVWCPNNSNSKGTDQRLYYPGDAYVDWICLDAYASAASGPANFSATITTNCNPPQPYQRLTNMTSKPMMIAEFGAEEGTYSKGAWFKQAALDLQNLFPRIKAIVYFNSGSYTYNSSSASIAGANAAFGGCGNTTLVKNLATYDTDTTSSAGSMKHFLSYFL